MKSIGAVAVLSLAALAEACADDYPQYARRHVEIHARQAPPASSSGSVSASSSASGSVVVPPGSSISTVPTATLRATNPTAIPLSSITFDMASLATADLHTTALPGEKPTGIANAPPIPTGRINPAEYPELDKIPPVDSPEVKRWIAEVAGAGLVIPTFSATNPGGCANNTALVSDASRCWWTCGGCVGQDDITDCKDKEHWGLTFDDGPGFYTPNLLEYLDEAKLKATFFVVGSRVVSFPETLQAQHVAGHQIAVHTWSHKALTTLTDAEIIAELGWTKKAIRDVLGVSPTHMRPPFGDIDNRVRAISLAMGLTPVMWTRHIDAETGPNGVVFNTQDFDIRQGLTSNEVLNQWNTIMDTVPRLTKGFITLQHDIYQEFVHLSTGYILPDAIARTPKLTIEPVITCNNMPMANAYIETNDNSTNPFKAKLGNAKETDGAKDDGAAAAFGSAAMGALFVGATGFAASMIAALF